MQRLDAAKKKFAATKERLGKEKKEWAKRKRVDKEEKEWTKRRKSGQRGE